MGRHPVAVRVGRAGIHVEIRHQVRGDGRSLRQYPQPCAQTPECAYENADQHRSRTDIKTDL